MQIIEMSSDSNGNESWQAIFGRDDVGTHSWSCRHFFVSRMKLNGGHLLSHRSIKFVLLIKLN